MVSGNKSCFEYGECYFMVKESIVHRNMISSQGIHVDQVKVKVIAKLPTSISVKYVRIFFMLGSIDGSSEISPRLLTFV